MEKEEKTGKEPKKVPTKSAIGLIGGTAAIIVGGFAIAYIIFTDKPQENSQEPIQANYVVGNVITNETLVNGNTILEQNELTNEITNTMANEMETPEETEKQEQTDTTEKKEETKKEENKKTEKKEETKKEPVKQEPTKQETSKQEETPVKKEPTIVKTEEEKQLTKSETKYGLTTNTYTVTTYNVYSDGSKKEKNSQTKTEKSGEFSATTAELLPEARQLKSQNASLINGVLGYVNDYRAEAKVEKITLDTKLTEAACAGAMEMAYTKNMSHTRPNGKSCFTILKDMSISYMACGENIAMGQRSAKAVATSWRNSEGHYKNMISTAYGKIGIGVMNYNGTYCWCQLFTN